MDQQELEALLADMESQRVERKSSVSDIHDNGNPTVLPITDELLLELSQPAKTQCSILALLAPLSNLPSASVHHPKPNHTPSRTSFLPVFFAP